MKKLIIPFIFVSALFFSCETSEDILAGLDHIVPTVEFLADSMEVNAGDDVLIEARVSDDSGIMRIEFSYGDWMVNEIIDFTNEAFTGEYLFSVSITVPENAEKVWEEEQYYNDASSVLIQQQFHSLVMKVWDNNRNFRKTECHIKVR